MIERFIEDGQLTGDGQKLAGLLVHRDCDRVPCIFCSNRNRETNGPGGSNCPAKDKLSSGAEVDKLLTIYLGKAPSLGALDSLLPRR